MCSSDLRYLEMAERLLWNHYATNRAPNGGYGHHEFACDADGPHHDLANALPVGVGQQYAKICDRPDFYRITGAGAHTVEIHFVHADGDLDLHAYDAAGAAAGTSESQSDTETVTVPAGGAVEVFGFNNAMGTYLLRVR